MRLTQDGEVGRGRLARVEGECRGDEAGGGGYAVFSRGPLEEEASRVSLSTGKSVLGNMSYNNKHRQTTQMFNRIKYSFGLILQFSKNKFLMSYSIIAFSICIYFLLLLILFYFYLFFCLFIA